MTLAELTDVMNLIEFPRMTMQHWKSTNQWAVYIFDGGTQIAEGVHADLPTALKRCHAAAVAALI